MTFEEFVAASKEALRQLRATGTLSAKRKGPQLPAVSPALARCVWEGMSNPVPVGSPRKSAADTVGRPRVLRSCRHRPCRRAAEQHDELAALCMTRKEHCEG
jgi:hypothetical protein